VNAYGNGKLSISGVGTSSQPKEAIRIAFDYFKANISRVTASAKVGDHDFHLHIVELHNTGPSQILTLASFIAFCSGLLAKPV
jgi:ATP-dependent Lon protease